MMFPEKNGSLKRFNADVSPDAHNGLIIMCHRTATEAGIVDGALLLRWSHDEILQAIDFVKWKSKYLNKRSEVVENLRNEIIERLKQVKAEATQLHEKSHDPTTGRDEGARIDNVMFINTQSDYESFANEATALFGGTTTNTPQHPNTTFPSLASGHLKRLTPRSSTTSTLWVYWEKGNNPAAQQKGMVQS